MIIVRATLGGIIYLGTGAVMAAIFSGGQADFQSIWGLAWMLGWPIMLAVWDVLVCLLSLVGIGAAIAIAALAIGGKGIKTLIDAATSETKNGKP